MNSIENIEHPTVCIIHFAQEEGLPHRRMIRYQVAIDPVNLSPSGKYIRFESIAGGQCGLISEVHGWVAVEDIVIDEVLEVIGTSEACESEEVAA